MPTKVLELKEAVGRRLDHDLTEIRPGEFKGAAFKRGHVVCDEDLCRLQKMGKNHIYVLELAESELHEDQAASMLAQALAGPGVVWEDAPSEGKISLHAAHDGLLRVDSAALAAFNLIDEVMCATLHDHTLVRQGEMVAATRAIPLVMQRAPVERAVAIASAAGGLVSVLRLRRAQVGLVITGDEVATGLIQDKFEPVLRRKVRGLGSEVRGVAFARDDAGQIAAAIRGHLQAGCDLILLTGGMSVDPDDQTRSGVAQAGAEEMYYGSAVLPGAMFLAAYLGEVPLLGVPACALYHRTTVLDLVLPRVLAGLKITKTELALMGHGGLCRNCEECIYPDCAFGKA